ncbi:MAG TPA: D-alanyl-D-alanine carboxypeptidase, partial [Acidobacteriaceae bacterium]|nr:D-alanyl-D-alanine carboxypeptidase [Acidobacteriaceae bacterium]
MRCVVCLAAILFISLPGLCQTQPAAGQQSQPAPVTHPVYPHGETTPLGAQIAALLADPAVSRAHWGIAVTALDGTPMYGLDEDKFFRPASNAKLYTTAAAMALLGPDTRVTTVVSSDAPPDANGVIDGDIVLHGVGDANLSGRHIPYENPTVYKARMAQEQASEAAAEKAAADAAEAAERERQRKAGIAASALDERVIAEAENDAIRSVRERRVPDELVSMEDLASQIAAKGVKSLTGALRGDASLWRSPGYASSWDEGDAV